MAFRISSRAWLEIALVIFVVVISVYAHLSLGYVCPLPWPDESHFLWPAISLAENGTLVSPELNPERPIFWMPHGYTAIIGGIFSVTGGSLVVARAFSLICVLLSVILFLRVLRKHNCSILSSIIAGCFFLNAYFIACGNIARMEAPLLLLVISGFALLLEQRTLTALGLLALTPLIHPNGFYFLAAAIVYTAIDCWRTKSRPQLTKLGLAFLLIAIACWVGYAVYCSQYWSFVKQDLTFQFARKGERSILGQILTLDNLALLITLIATLALSSSSNRRRLTLLVLAFPCWAIQIVGFEMWYRVFWMLAALIISILFVESLREFVYERMTKVHRYARFTLISLPVCVVVGWHLYRGNLESPFNYPFQMKFFELATPDRTDYLSANDRERISEIIAKESVSHLISVQFFPRAEALFYLNLRSDRVKFSDPLFHTRLSDLYIFHESKYLPPRWLRFLANDMSEAGLNPQERGRFIAFERDAHERWYVYRPTR